MKATEPRFTQPLLYKAIASHPNPGKFTVRTGLTGCVYRSGLHLQDKEFDDELEQKLELSSRIRKLHIKQFLEEDWKGYIHPEGTDYFKRIHTGLPLEKLKETALKIKYAPVRPAVLQ